MSYPLTIPSNVALPMHASIDEGLAKVETVLNIPGYFPIVSSISGGLRILFGKIEVIAAIALGALLILKGVLFSSNAQERSRQIDYGIAVMMNYALHGVANMGRGLVETIPLLNFGCLAYDMMDKRMKYQFERV